MNKMIDSYGSYNLWANKRLADFLKDRDPAIFDHPFVSSFPTLRKTIYHIMDAEHIWYNRLQGNSIREWPSKNIEPGNLEFLDKWTKTSHDLLGLGKSFSNDQLEAGKNYTNIKGKSFTQPVWQILMHVFNHSTFHRGQVVSAIRNAGITEVLPSTDWIVFFRE